MNPDVPGLIIKSTPKNPNIIARALKTPIDSVRTRAPKSVTVKGNVCKSALAFASGILNRAVKKSKVAHKSAAVLNNTKGQSFL